jgi:hypothetical protein
MYTDEDLNRHAAENLAQANALLFGRVTYAASWSNSRQATIPVYEDTP